MRIQQILGRHVRATDERRLSPGIEQDGVLLVSHKCYRKTGFVSRDQDGDTGATLAGSMASSLS